MSIIALRYFPPSSPDGEVAEKRLKYPEKLRQSHLMLTGGRDGAAVSGRVVPAAGKPTYTGWNGKPSAAWKKKLQAGQTPEDARTQSAFLRKVRPEQRAWARGVMRVADIERVIYGGLVPVTRSKQGQIGPVDIYLPEQPEVEITLWVESESTFASVVGHVFYLRQVIGGHTGDPERDAAAWKAVQEILHVDTEKKIIHNPHNVVNSVLYAHLLGIVFKPSDRTPLLGSNEEIVIPYYQIGRVRQIFSAKKHPWSRSAYPTHQAGKPTDTQFQHVLAPLERAITTDRVDASVQHILTPNKPYTRDVTPSTSVEALIGDEGIAALQLRSTDPLEGTETGADTLSVLNLYRAAGARIREIQGKPVSVIERPHDPLRLTYEKRTKRKKPPTEDYSNIFLEDTRKSEKRRNNPAHFSVGDRIKDAHQIYKVIRVFSDGSLLIQAESRASSGPKAQLKQQMVSPDQFGYFALV